MRWSNPTAESNVDIEQIYMKCPENIQPFNITDKIAFYGKWRLDNHFEVLPLGCDRIYPSVRFLDHSQLIRRILFNLSRAL